MASDDDDARKTSNRKTLKIVCFSMMRHKKRKMYLFTEDETLSWILKGDKREENRETN